MLVELRLVPSFVLLTVMPVVRCCPLGPYPYLDTVRDFGPLASVAGSGACSWVTTGSSVGVASSSVFGSSLSGSTFAVGVPDPAPVTTMIPPVERVMVGVAGGGGSAKAAASSLSVASADSAGSVDSWSVCCSLPAEPSSF